MPDSPQITPRILVTTDFSLESERAFYHALSFAVSRRARLTLLHTGSESRDQVPWDRFPGVRTTLSDWRLLPPDAPRSAVAESLGVSVNKMALRDDDPRQGITEYLRKRPTDLLVMATEGRTGLARLFNPSVAETVSYQTRSFTLMLPTHGRGFVDPATGRATLHRVLFVPEPDHDPRSALAFLAQWLPALAGNAVEVTFLQVCEPEQAQRQPLPQVAGVSWQWLTRPGERLPVILAAARELQADLVAMGAGSRLGLMGRLRGSPIDRVLRDLQVPVLSMPHL